MSLPNLKSKFLDQIKVLALALPLSVGSVFQASADGITEEQALAMCTLPHKGYSCATGGWSEPMTAEEIKNSSFAKNRIVYHFGKGFIRAGIAADINTVEYSAPTIAIPGGPDGKLDIYIDGKKANRSFTQNEMDRGALGLYIQKKYKELMQMKGVD